MIVFRAVRADAAAPLRRGDPPKSAERWILAAIVIAALFAPPPSAAQTGRAEGGASPLVVTPEDDNAAGVHLDMANTAELSGARAERIYRAILPQMLAAYAESDDPILSTYTLWHRFNRHPYRSANHGQRFVNHYGNDKAADYGLFENLEAMPQGAILIKDSFTVTVNGDIMVGPLFMMEKMPAGSLPESDDWRYLMLDSDGEPVGMTGGTGSQTVGFCAACHRMAPTDSLLFMPEEVRVRR